MNLFHRWCCRSARWRTTVEKHIVPWVLEGIDLGANVLELGPGPGVTTDLLRIRVQHLTCVEVDKQAATALSRRMSGKNVKVLCQDATRTSLPAGAFDSVASFTMLHHIPSEALQDRLFAEAGRVLRPGGVFVGTDSLTSPMFRLMHVFDTLVPVDPSSLPGRLAAAGFTDIRVDVMTPYAFRFRAQRPH